MADNFREETMRNGGHHEDEYEAGVTNVDELKQLHRKVAVSVWTVGDRVSSVSYISAVVVLIVVKTVRSGT
jgi:hypothetical protein